MNFWPSEPLTTAALKNELNCANAPRLRHTKSDPSGIFEIEADPNQVAFPSIQ
jgi:hypothetical protein